MKIFTEKDLIQILCLNRSLGLIADEFKLTKQEFIFILSIGAEKLTISELINKNKKRMKTTEEPTPQWLKVKFTKLSNILVEKKLLTKMKSTLDKRKYYLKLTKKGLNIFYKRKEKDD
ncbi:MAG: hypothetical protein K4H23_05330 [Mollicutes bacterium PWAP]|nr:hypothetical protein [Mollicutes bacterium PWAP]